MKAAVDILRLIAHRNITLERSQKGVKRVCNGLYKGVEAHQFMIASASGYAAGEKVQLVLYPGAVVVGSFLADASGEFSARFRVPDDTRPGAHVAEATGWVSGFVANKDFVVTTTVLAAGVPLLWWVVVVLAVLLISAISLLVYFRQSSLQWFGGAVAPQGSTP